MRPLDPADPDVRKLAMIDLARQRGATWAVVARVLHVHGVTTPAAAKKYRNRLAREVRRRQFAG